MQIEITSRGVTVTVDTDKMPEAAIAYATRYGFIQCIADAASGAEKTATETGVPVADVTRELMQRKIDALLRGDIRVGSARTADPVKAEAIRIATEKVKTAVRAKGHKVSEFDAKWYRGKALELIAKRPDITEQAKKNVEANRALEADVEI